MNPSRIAGEFLFKHLVKGATVRDFSVNHRMLRFFSFAIRTAKIEMLWSNITKVPPRLAGRASK